MCQSPQITNRCEGYLPSSLENCLLSSLLFHQQLELNMVQMPNQSRLSPPQLWCKRHSSRTTVTLAQTRLFFSIVYFVEFCHTPSTPPKSKDVTRQIKHIFRQWRHPSVPARGRTSLVLVSKKGSKCLIGSRCLRKTALTHSFQQERFSVAAEWLQLAQGVLIYDIMQLLLLLLLLSTATTTIKETPHDSRQRPE